MSYTYVLKGIKTTNVNRDEILQKHEGIHTLVDQKGNKEILQKLEVEPVDEKLQRHKSTWLRRVTRMSSNRM
jgi:hypothetical protein